ncbi:MAG TPA: sulfotransferase [Actinopolymorphaceae bacterium]|nr:sulfotransferase [Actinopolymorphaceae bacterium]
MGIVQISRAERATSPVFIVGEGRSGTTILYRVLQKHPAFRPRAGNLWESKVLSHTDRAASFRSREPRTLFGYMSDNDACYDAFLTSIAPLRPLLWAGETTRRLAPFSRGMSLVWAASGHPLVVRSYFHHARTARGVTRILEKTPDHVRHVDRLLRCYPRARLLYIHRHPVDVYTSFLRRAEVDPGYSRWAEMSAEEFAARWETRTMLALDAAARLSGSLLLLAYEHFTTRPEAAVRQICEFVAEPYDPEIVVEHKPDLTRRKADPHIFGSITTKTKEWRDYISKEDADVLQNRLRPVMARLSYDAYDYDS